MSDVIKKVCDEMPYRFLGHQVFLPAVAAITARYKSTTIKAVIFYSFFGVAHSRFLLKITNLFLMLRITDMKHVFLRKAKFS